MRESVVIRTDWLINLKKRMTEQQYNEVCARMLDYGCFEEYQESDDVLINSSLDWLFPQIDNMQESYAQMIKNGKKGGRPSTLDNAEIWRLANKGVSGATIAERMGIPKTTLYSSEGWKNRKDAGYLDLLK